MSSERTMTMVFEGGTSGNRTENNASTDVVRYYDCRRWNEYEITHTC